MAEKWSDERIESAAYDLACIYLNRDHHIVDLAGKIEAMAKQIRDDYAVIIQDMRETNGWSLAQARAIRIVKLEQEIANLQEHLLLGEAL